ncbi:DNA-3-methyladenine glycosylase I [Uliginosibacterium sp. H1]|uniref:DNA-3-methyladenine glycosylase I n=1 Tax=Uliginosibacterium sp. H1 TaxID=3114757 RepID=UPI002E17F326|nr:DNA-3-methyladenine glycosylase I [Uliginosibacterium sp. H1]
MADTAPKRCTWPGEDPLYVAYHDEEWGVPVHDDGKLFEFITLEGAQAGLSWITILRKRENYRRAFAGFDARKIAQWDDRHVEKLMQDAGIVRNRAKINATIGNARAFLELQARHGSFAEWMWGFVNGKPIQNRWKSTSQVPASTPVSDLLSKELKRAGFRFVGSTIIYAHMQAVGMVNDHLTTCFRHRELRP